MKKNPVPYNINYMRPALIAAREDGNRKKITKEFCRGLGIDAGYFRTYNNAMENLYAATCEYCAVKNSPLGIAETMAERTSALSTLLDDVYRWYKELLSMAEKDRMERELHATKHDISNLIGFCQKFVNDCVNVTFDDDFNAKKVWANAKKSAFVKSVETDLGIRIAGVDMLSDEDRDILKEQQKLVSKVNKLRSKNDALEQSKIVWGRAKSKATGEAGLILQEQIDEIDRKIKENELEVETTLKQLDELLKKQDDEPIKRRL